MNSVYLKTKLMSDLSADRFMVNILYPFFQYLDRRIHHVSEDGVVFHNFYHTETSVFGAPIAAKVGVEKIGEAIVHF